MNKATLVGVWPSDKPTEPCKYDYDFEEDYISALEDHGSDALDCVLDTIVRDTTFIVAEHTLGHITDESFRLLMDYLSKYDAMLRGEI
jgi:hypothetical protein